LVVEHFFEMRDEPDVIDGVAVEAATELVVDTGGLHFIAGEEDVVAGFLVVGVEEEAEGGDLGEFGGFAEAAVFEVGRGHEVLAGGG